MGTISDKLTYIEGTKDAIKQAIIAKGVSVSLSDTFRSYASKINDIETGGSIAGAPSGMRFAYSTFTTVPQEIFPYLEQQTDLSRIFDNCKSLITVSLFNTNKATDMNWMFNNCKALETVPLFDTSNVIDMHYMFNNCKALETVPQFDTGNVVNMNEMFTNCEKLQTVPQFDTGNVVNMNEMFYYCNSLTTVPLFDTSKVNDMNWIFGGCTSLTNLGGFTGLKLNLDLGYSPKLTVESVMNVITNASDMTSSPKTLTLSKTVFNKLSQEQISTATAKGWNIAER